MELILCLWAFIVGQSLISQPVQSNEEPDRNERLYFEYTRKLNSTLAYPERYEILPLSES